MEDGENAEAQRVVIRCLRHYLGEFFGEEVFYDVGGGFAFGEFHDLADEEVVGFVFAVFVVFDGGGVFCEDLIDEGFDGRGIA